MNLDKCAKLKFQRYYLNQIYSIKYMSAKDLLNKKTKKKKKNNKKNFLNSQYWKKHCLAQGTLNKFNPSVPAIHLSASPVELPVTSAGSYLVTGESCHKYHFCRNIHVTKLLSRQNIFVVIVATKYFCRDCRDKIFLSWQNTSFVATNVCLLTIMFARQRKFVVTKLLQWQFLWRQIQNFCRDKNDNCGS